MRTLITIITLLGLTAVCHAQCEDKISGRQLQKGMFIYCDPADAVEKRYVAEILTVSGTDFSCRFLHSNSVYQFTDFKRAANGTPATMQACVKSSKGGGFAQGAIFIMNVYMQDPDVCDLSGTSQSDPYEIIATFKADNKRYLGRIISTTNGYLIKFDHSNSMYTVDKNFKVIAVKNGGYIIGSQLSVVHARTLQF